jgi:serine protease Do
VLLGCAPVVAEERPAPRNLPTQVAQSVVKLYGAAAGREHGYGTGVIVSPDGMILTVQSLLVTSRTVRVVLADGRLFDGKLVRSDESRQLALLKIEAADLPHLSPEKTDGLTMGDTVFAMGNCFKIAEGDEPVSVFRGVISARSFLEARRLSQDFEYTGPVIIYDAITANPGSAGGPLLDLDGRFVGLVGKVVESVQTNTRLNYALPGEELLTFLGGDKAAIASSQPRSTPTESTDAPAVDIGIKLSSLGYRQATAFVQRVRPGSPAEIAGVQVDDLIVAIDGRRVPDKEACEKALRSMRAGPPVRFLVKRGEQMIEIPVETSTRQ